MTLTPKVNICTRKVCLRLMKPLHTKTGEKLPSRSIYSAMSLIGNIEFPTFKEPKTKRCKTLYPICLAHTFTASQGKYGVNSAAKVRKIKLTANKKSENYFCFRSFEGLDGD